MSDVKNDKEYLQDEVIERDVELDRALEKLIKFAERRKAKEAGAAEKETLSEEAKGGKPQPRKKAAEKSEPAYVHTLTDAVRYTFEFIKRNRSDVKKALAKIDDCEELIVEDLSIYNSNPDEPEPEEIYNLVDDVNQTFCVFKKLFVKLMCHANVIHSMEFIMDYYAGREDKLIERTITEPEGIRCSAEPRCIMLSMPLLPNSRCPKVSTHVGRKIVPLDHVNLLGRQIDMVLDRELSKTDIDTRVFGKLDISYLYIYTDDMSAVDNDNRDTYFVTNSLCKNLGTTDAPNCCWFQSTALKTDELPIGTYVTVTPMDDGFADPMKVVEKWKNLLGNQR